MNFALNEARSEESDRDSDEDLKVVPVSTQGTEQGDTKPTESDDCLRPINPFEDMDMPVTPSMRQFKKELLADVETDVEQRRCMSTLGSIWQYLTAEHDRYPKNIKIGIMTVFILTMVISFFQSVIDVSPILFVKVG